MFLRCLLCGQLSDNQFCDECRAAYADEIARYERFYNIRIILMMLPLVLIIPMIVFNEYILVISALFCVLEGVTLFLLPYSIPNTIRIIGFDNDTRLNRRIAIVLIVLGILFLLVYALT